MARLLSLILLLVLFPLPLAAQNAIILIQHADAGPNLPKEDVLHPNWVRWPTDQKGWNNRIVSLACGVDLRGESADMGFVNRLGGQRSSNADSLLRRGFFAARKAYLGGVPTAVLANRFAGTSPSVLFLALDEPERIVQPLPFGSPLPAGGLVAYEAKGWTDAIEIADRVSGRTLIVEYPPDGEDGWSRFWQRGRWPEGVAVESDIRVPGLIRGKRVLELLLHPERFGWQASTYATWGGPNRWLDHGHAQTPILLGVWALVATFVIAWALAQVMNEDRGPFVSELLVIVALSPATFLLAGAGARIGGLDAWPVWLALAPVALYCASLLVGLLIRRIDPEAHPLVSSSLVGLATCVLCDPVWSEFSNRFGGFETDISGLALGAFVAYAAGTMTFAPGRWFGRALAVAILLWAVTAHPWWIREHSALLTLPVVALLAAEGLFRWPFLMVLALLPTGLLRIAREGIAWNFDGLPTFANQEHALDLRLTAMLLGSPEWGGFLAFSATVALVGNRFLAYRLRKLWRLDPRLRALPWTAAGLLALGVTEPLTLPAVPIVAFGGLLALAYDGLRANA